MRSLVIHYSRTGNTATVADALAKEFDADVLELSCAKYGRGPIRYLFAGYDSVRGNLPEINAPDFIAEAYDLVLLGTPIWTSYPSLPMRAFLAKKPSLPKRICLFLTYGGHSPPEKAVEQLQTALPQPIETSLTLGPAELKQPKLTAVISTFADRIKANSALLRT
ncbi:MAG: hypothetical protein AAFV69_09850 [Pseudomonadota bacterium]